MKDTILASTCESLTHNFRQIILYFCVLWAAGKAGMIWFPLVMPTSEIPGKIREKFSSVHREQVSVIELKISGREKGIFALLMNEVPHVILFKLSHETLDEW